MSSALPPEDSHEHRLARLRAIRFLSEHAFAVGGAYAFAIGPTGRLTIQGTAGSLDRLVQMLDAQPVPAANELWREWEASVASDGGQVSIHLSEDAPDLAS